MTPEELLQEVKRLQITARHIVTEVFAGEYSSAFKGRGMEFADVREYEPGDDVRTIDWNVTARAGKPFVKRFTEERELTVMLAVDLSGSERFGSERRMKQNVAAEVCAVIAFAAMRNNDRVGLMVFTDEVELFVPPAKGSRHVLRLVRELLAYKPKNKGTNLDTAVNHMARSLKRRSVIFVVSDFLTASPAESLRILKGKHDTTAILVEDPREQKWPSAGLIELEDPETGRRFLIDAGSGRVRRAYELAALARRNELLGSFGRLGIDTLAVSTRAGDDRHPAYVHELMMFFRKRERRRSA